MVGAGEAARGPGLVGYFGVGLLGVGGSAHLVFGEADYFVLDQLFLGYFAGCFGRVTQHIYVEDFADSCLNLILVVSGFLLTEFLSYGQPPLKLLIHMFEFLADVTLLFWWFGGGEALFLGVWANKRHLWLNLIRNHVKATDLRLLLTLLE